MTPTYSDRDSALLSAYLDGQLSSSELRAVQARLKTDADFFALLQRLRQVRNLLRQVPMRRAPRNFMLTPGMAGIKPPVPRFVPLFRFASALAAVLFLFMFTVNLSFPMAASVTEAEAVQSFAVQDAGTCTDCTAEIAPQAPALAAELPADGAQTTSTPEVSTFMEQPAPQPVPQQKAMPSAESQPVQAGALSLPVLVQLGLLAVTVVFAGVAFWGRFHFEQDWYRARSIPPQKLKWQELALLLLGVLVALALVWLVLFVSGALGW